MSAGSAMPRFAQKLIALGLITSACALVVASVVFLIATYVGARRQTREAVLVQTAITTDNISAAARLRRPHCRRRHASRASGAPDRRSRVRLGRAGTVLRRVPTSACRSLSPVTSRQRSIAARSGRSKLGQPITVGNAAVGSLYIRANLSNVTSQLRAQAYATLLALLLGAAAAILFARRFQQAHCGTCRRARGHGA